MSLRHRLQDAFFRAVHRNRLIYNTCWEDPRADRELLRLDVNSRVAMITSAGCNALDYLLDDPARIDCVDLNPRQNALLELKLAVFEGAGHEELFELFGQGGGPRHRAIYAAVRDRLSVSARAFWDRHLYYFDPQRRGGSFYFYGTAGHVAWSLRQYLRLLRPGLHSQLLELVEAPDLATQQAVYAAIEPKLWTGLARWAMRQPAVMSLLGVPRAQIELIQAQHPGGLEAYVRDKLRQMATQVPMRDNYFWRVYLTGRYTRDCCPNYLRAEHFATLRARVERIRTHTMSFSAFLQQYPGRYTHFILLDHQDWLAHHDPEALAEEWRLILASSQPGARVLMRSACTSIDFLPAFALRCMRRYEAESRALHARDRVGTYGSTLCAGLL